MREKNLERINADSKPGHFYVYEYRNGKYIYERTCGTRSAARDRVRELAGRGIEAIYLINHTIKGAYY